MKKIFKKSLAIMVSAAICLTALIGCLSVSAATRGKGTFTVGKISGKAGASVTVPIELKYTSGGEGMGIAASLFDVSFDATALTITDIVAGDDAKAPIEGVPDEYEYFYTVKYRSVDGTEEISVVDNAIRILAMPADDKAVVTSMQALLTFTINDGAEAKAYDITITEEQTCDFGIAESTEVSGAFGNFEYTGDAEFIDMTVNNGKVTVVEDAPVCTHENLEFVSAVPATAEAEGTIQLKCAICEETKAESILYNKFTTVASASASAESEVFMQFDAYTNLFTEGSDIDSVIITIDKENYNAENTLYIMGRDDAVSFESGSYTGLRWKLGLPAKTLNDDVTVYVYCKAGDKWYNGQVLNYSFTTYAKNMLSKETTPAANKAVIMDLVNYGSTAQTLFNYDVDNLANAGFEEYQKYGTPTDVIPEAINEMVTRQDVATDPVLVAQVNLMAEDRVTIRYTLMPKNYSGSADDVKAIISYTNSKGEKITTEYISYDKAVENGLSDKISAGEYFTVVNGNYVLDFSRLAAAEMKTLVTIDVYVNDDLSSSVDYSVQSFVARMRANGTATPEQTACYNAMLRYGDSARIAFSN